MKRKTSSRACSAAELDLRASWPTADGGDGERELGWLVGAALCVIELDGGGDHE